MICVDDLKPSRWRYKRSCHLFSMDSPEETLHLFAAKLGLKRSWFQDDPRLPHYDLSPRKRKRAVELGAIEVTSNYVKDAIKNNQKLYTEGYCKQIAVGENNMLPRCSGSECWAWTQWKQEDRR